MKWGGWYQSAPENPLLLNIVPCGIPVYSFFGSHGAITVCVHLRREKDASPLPSLLA